MILCFFSMSITHWFSNKIRPLRKALDFADENHYFHQLLPTLSLTVFLSAIKVEEVVVDVNQTPITTPRHGIRCWRSA